MNFSYLSPEDIMPKIEDPNYYESADLVDNDDTIINSQSFFARVLNRVQGSHLPFIFNINDINFIHINVFFIEIIINIS